MIALNKLSFLFENFIAVCLMHKYSTQSINKQMTFKNSFLNLVK